MLAFFRRLINSPIGIVIALITLMVIGLAFAAGDVTGLSSRFGSGGPAADTLVTVGKTTISAAEMRQRMGNVLQAQQQRNPGVTMAQLIGAGAYEQVVDGMIDDAALAEWGRSMGMIVSKKVVDGQIASIPAFAGPDGKFNETAYRQRLAEIGVTDDQVRREFTRQELVQQLRLPMMGATQVPVRLAIPYSLLLLETRTANVAAVPLSAMPAGAAPTDAELTAFYKTQAVHYTLPERRVMRYAVVSPAAVATQAVPTDAELAQAYAAQGARFAAKQTRDVDQVVLASQADANAFAAKVKAGASLVDAAKAAGLDATPVRGAEKAGYAAQTSPAIADAVFGAAQGAVVGPLRGPIGFIVAKVAAINQVPAKSLDAAKPDLVKELSVKKSALLMTQLRQRLEAGLNNNAGFDALTGSARLTPVTTAAVTNRGLDPLSPPPAQPDPVLAQVAAAGFSARPTDAPQLVPTDKDGSFALVQLAKVIPAAPRPLAEIRPQVEAAFRQNRARGLARKAAADILAKVNAGTPLAAAIAASGLSLPAPQSVTKQRITAFNPRQAPPPSQSIIFSLAPGKANMVEDPTLGGFAIVQLVGSKPGDLTTNPGLAGQLQGSFAQSVGTEYAQELAAAARKAIGVKRNEAAIARLKGELLGTVAPTGTQP